MTPSRPLHAWGRMHACTGSSQAADGNSRALRRNSDAFPLHDHILMAIRGRKPKPTPLKILAGDRADRINRSEPRPGRSLPDCPDHLDADGREAWDRIVPGLDALGVLTTQDTEALALYCAAYGRWRKANEEVRKGGVTTFSEQGALKINPAVTVAQQAERLMAAILMEFGLTPASRSRVKTDARPHDALADFLARRKK